MHNISIINKCATDKKVKRRETKNMSASPLNKYSVKNVSRCIKILKKIHTALTTPTSKVARIMQAYNAKYKYIQQVCSDVNTKDAH